MNLPNTLFNSSFLLGVALLHVQANTRQNGGTIAIDGPPMIILLALLPRSLSCLRVTA
jgi:hypothetical protein